MLIDSNIVIYASLPEYPVLRKFIRTHSPSVSAISYVEVLGYHNLSNEDKDFFEEFFKAANVLPVSFPVLDNAVSLRQERKMALGDALIAGTAIVHDLTLVTNNEEDFKWIEKINLLNPLKNEQISISSIRYGLYTDLGLNLSIHVSKQEKRCHNTVMEIV